MLLLIRIYLKYGLSSSKKIYNSTYWFSQNYKTMVFLKYYRKADFFNNLSQTVAHYQFRLKAPLSYQAKISLFSYNKWFIVLVQWFEPDKRLKHRLTLSKQKIYENFLINKDKHIKIPTRYILTHKLITRQSTNYTLPYHF